VFNSVVIETRLGYLTESKVALVFEEKVRILIPKYDADYYVLVGEVWTPKDLGSSRTYCNEVLKW
jgi:hypothetical protein